MVIFALRLNIISDPMAENYVWYFFNNYPGTIKQFNEVHSICRFKTCCTTHVSGMFYDAESRMCRNYPASCHLIYRLCMYFELLNLLRAYFRGTAVDAALFEGLGEEQWQSLFTVAARHNVSSIALDALENATISIPNQLYIKWIVCRERDEERYARQMDVLGDIVSVCSAGGIRTMVLKGAGAAQYYPVAKHRQCSDVDVYFYGRSADADRLLAREFGVEIRRHYYSHHTTFLHRYTLVENHFKFLNDSGCRSNRVFNELLAELAGHGNARLLPTPGGDAIVPSDNFNLLYLARHMASGFVHTGISFRHLCDWMLAAEKCFAAEGVEAMERADAVFRRFNMHRFMNAVKGILIDRLGTPPGLFPHFEREEALQERIFREICEPTSTKLIRRSKGRLQKFFLWQRDIASYAWKHRIVYNESPARYSLNVIQHRRKYRKNAQRRTGASNH